MRIESIIRRKNGSVIPMFGTNYEFKPEPDGRHIAVVDDQAHIEQFLSIAEGYRDADAKVEAPVVKPVKKAELVALIGSGSHPATFTMPNGAVISLGEAVGRAHADSNLSVENWNNLGEEERCDAIDAALDRIEAENPVPSADDVEREQASLDYQAKFGKKPHYLWKADKIRTEIAAKEAAA